MESLLKSMEQHPYNDMKMFMYFTINSLTIGNNIARDVIIKGVFKANYSACMDFLMTTEPILDIRCDLAIDWERSGFNSLQETSMDSFEDICSRYYLDQDLHKLCRNLRRLDKSIKKYTGEDYMNYTNKFNDLVAYLHATKYNPK